MEKGKGERVGRSPPLMPRMLPMPVGKGAGQKDLQSCTSAFLPYLKFMFTIGNHLNGALLFPA